MVSMRRLRAVLLFAILSAIGWVIIVTLMLIGVSLLGGRQLSMSGLIAGAKVEAVIGFAAGTTWAVAIALLPRKADQSVTALSAILAGALGGLLVASGMYIAMGNLSFQLLAANLLTLGIASCIGGVVGLAIQRVAARGQLPVPEPSPKAIEP